MEKTFEIADLVKWYDYYVDEIVRDAGLGVVMEVIHSHPSEDHQWTNYSVYKFKTGRMGWFDEFELDQIIPPVPKR
jgi:hypothetical protein